MTPHQDIVHGGWPAVIATSAGAFIGWFFGGASPAVMLSVSIGLVIGVLKLYDLIQRKRKGRPLDSGSMPLDDR